MLNNNNIIFQYDFTLHFSDHSVKRTSYTPVRHVKKKLKTFRLFDKISD